MQEKSLKSTGSEELAASVFKVCAHKCCHWLNLEQNEASPHPPALSINMLRWLFSGMWCCVLLWLYASVQKNWHLHDEGCDNGGSRFLWDVIPLGYHHAHYHGNLIFLHCHIIYASVF